MKFMDHLFRKTRTIRKANRNAKAVGMLLRLEDRIAPANVGIDSNFAGIPFSQSGGWVPPDTCGAAGTSQYVETVNQEIELFNKSTGASLARVSMGTFLFTTGGLSRADGSSSQSDPIVTWDEQIQRFIVGQQDVDFGNGVGAFDIAVSKTATPTTLGTSDWEFYKISTIESTFFPDYPGNFGWNHDAFVFTLNMFPSSSGSAHVLVTAVSIQDLVNGVASPHVFQTDNDNEFSLRPTVMHDSVANDPMWLVEDNGDGQTIDVVRMDNILSSSPTITTTTLTVNSFSEITGSHGTPKQPNGGSITTNIDSRIIKAAEMNNTLVASQAITNSAGDRDMARWYEIDVSSGTPAISDQGNLVAGNAGSAKYYDVYPSVDINAHGDIGMTFVESANVNSSTEFMSVYATGRTPNDPSGTMETPVLVKAGDSNNGDGREGDLSGINLDSDGTFWLANELTTGGAWNTWIAHFTVNAAPVLAGIEGSNLVFDAGMPALNITQTMTVSDADTATLAGATIQISSNFASGQDVLGFTNQNGITGTYNSATGVLTLSGVATLAQYQTALRSVTYLDTSVTPSTLTRTVTFQVNDGVDFNNLSNTQTRNITVSPHVAPVLAGIEASPISYTGGQGPINVTASLTVSDVDSTTISSATVSISAGFASGEDILAFTSIGNITGSYNSSTGVLTLTGVDTLNRYQTALRSVTYDDPNANPTTGARTITFQVNDGFANNNLSNTQSRNINVTAHVAPVLSGIEPGTIAYTAGQGAVNITSTLAVSDSDSATIADATVKISSGFVSAEDVLTFANQLGITGSYNSATGVLTLTGVASVANYQTALRSVTYTDSNLLPVASTRTITFQVDDGFAVNNLSNTQSRNISVTDHVAPVLANIESGIIAYTAGQGTTQITNAITVSDSDSATISGATISITSGLVKAEDVLAFTNTPNISGSYNSNTGVLTLTGADSLANYQAALRNVTYQDTNLLPVAGTRTITFQVNDGFANNNLSNTQARNVSVTDHVAPVLANIEPGTIAYTAGQGTTVITSQLTVSDSDSTTIKSATVSITSGLVKAEDLLAFANTANITGSYNSTTGVLTLTGVDTLANYQAALRTVTYQDTNILPVASTRTITFQVNDGFANNNLSNTQSRNVAVSDHVAPVLANIESSAIPYTAGQAATPITSALTVTDSDSTTIASATVSITAGYVKAEDFLAFTNTANITGSYNSTTGVLTLTGIDTLANYQAALHTVTYQDTNILPVASTRTITFRVNDGFANNNLSNTQSRNVVVTDHVAPSLSGIESSTLSYVTGQGAANITSSLTVADTDSTTIASATVSISVGFHAAEDVLSFTNTPNITGSYNSATGVLTLTGVDTLANYQSALQNVTYTDNSAAPSTVQRTVTFQVNDGFANNNISNTQSRKINVSTHVAPVLAGIEAGALSFGAGQSATAITGSLTVTDSDSSTIASATVSITVGLHSAEDVLAFANTSNITGSYNSATGVLTLTGIDTVANYQAALRNVTYQDTNVAPATTARTVTFQVTDTWPIDNASNTQSRNITVTAHVPPALAGIETTALSYGAGQAPTAVTNTMTVADSDSPAIASATATISAGFHSAEDVLGFTNQNGITGSYNSATGVLTLSGAATIAQYQAALRSVTFQDTNVAPATTIRTVTFQVTDTFGANNLSNTQSRNIAVTPHVAPALAGIESSTLSYVTGQGPLSITATTTVTDSDNPTIASATISITTNFAAGEDVLAFTNTPNITGSYNAATGVLTLTGVDTVANYQAAIRSVSYSDNSATPSTKTRTVSFQVSDGFGANQLSNVVTRNISVSAHVAPALANIESSTLPYTAGQAPTAVTSALTLTDTALIQGAFVTITAGIVPAEDVLAFTNTPNITGVYNLVTGTLTLTGVDTAADYQAALRTVTYQDTNLLPTPGNRTVNFQVFDTFLANNFSNTVSRKVGVADHVAPVLSGIEASTIPFTAGQSAVAITSSLTASDSNSATLAGATVSISSGFAAGEDVLGFTNQNGISGSYDSATGVLTLTGTATVAQYQAALRTVTYVDTNVAPTVGTRTITFQVDDGFANNNISNSQSRNISVSAHVAPVLSGIEASPVSFTLGNAAVAITGSLTVADVDSATIASATVAITSGFVSGDDILAFTNQNGITGSYNSGTGVLTLTGTATLAQYQAALRTVTYFNGNAFTALSARTVTFQVNDGFANNNISNTQARTINVSAHVAPVLSGIESTVAKYFANQPAIPITNTLTVTDSDRTTIAGATVSITSGLVSAEDVLGFVTQNGITGSYNSATGVLTLSGVATVAQYQAALRSVTYVDSNSKPTAGTRTVTFQVDDGFGNNNLSNTQSRDVSISTVPPSLLVVSGNNSPLVKVYDGATHALKYTLNPFGTGFVNGMHVTTGTMTNDGAPDIFIAEGQVGFPVVAIYDGASGQLIRKLQAFSNSYRSGAFIAVADLEGTGIEDLVVSQGQGGQGQVAVYRGTDLINTAIANPKPLWQFNPYGTFSGGVSLAAYRNASGGFIVTAPLVGMQSWVQVYNFATHNQTARFLAYASSYTQGLTVAAGDVNGDGFGDIVTAPNQPNAPVAQAIGGSSPGAVQVFDGNATATIFNLNLALTPYLPVPNSGVHIALVDINNDGLLDIVTSPATTTNNSSPSLKAFSGLTGADITPWDWIDTDFLGGVFIG